MNNGSNKIEIISLRDFFQSICARDESEKPLDEFAAYNVFRKSCSEFSLHVLTEANNKNAIEAKGTSKFNSESEMTLTFDTAMKRDNLKRDNVVVVRDFKTFNDLAVLAENSPLDNFAKVVRSAL